MKTCFQDSLFVRSLKVSMVVIRKALEELLFTSFGTPGKLVTDGGKEFKCEELKYLEQKNMVYEETPVTTAQCNPTGGLTGILKYGLQLMFRSTKRIGTKISRDFNLHISR